MKITKQIFIIIVIIAVTTFIFLMALFLPSFMHKQKKPFLVIHNAFTEQVGHFARGAHYVAECAQLINFKFFHDKDILSVLERVQKGKIDGAITGLYWWGEKDPILYLTSTVPFHLSHLYIYQFMQSNQGKEFYDIVGRRCNIKILPCEITGIQINGWWKKVPQKVGDLHGLKMRMPGLAGQVFQRLGATLVNDISPEDLLLALKENRIDVVEWATSYADLQQKFHTINPYAMVPGWHEPGTLIHLIINKDSWDNLSSKEQKDIEKACDYALFKQIMVAPEFDGKAMTKLKKEGAIFVQWPKEFLQAFYQTFMQIVQEYSKADPFFSKFYNTIHRYIIDPNYYLEQQEVPLIQFIKMIKSEEK